MSVPPLTSPIGQPLRRREDERFLTGAGQYTDDVVMARQSHGVFLRSPHAHARIKSIDLDAAKKAPGVIDIFTGADLADAKVGGLPCGWLIHSTDGSPMKEPAHPVMAQGKVRYVGEQVALVVAETQSQGKDAAELIEVDYDELPAVMDISKADGAPSAVHDDVPNNVCYDWGHGNKEAVDAAFATAAHISRLEYINNRLIPNAMEPRAVNASYTKHDDSYVLYVANQNPHVERLLMCAFVLGLPESKVRVIAPDVGGGFGSKIALYPEDTALIWASKRVGRPIKWTAERSESFLSDTHGRDHATQVELALDAKGMFLALRVKTIANLGAYLSTFGSAVPTILYGTLLAGQYKTPAIYVDVKAVFTNTAPVDAYRGAGRPEATYAVERIVEQAARDMKMDPAAIRRQNFVTEFPYATPVGLTYDSGDYGAHLDKALQMADVAGYPARKAASKAKGRLRGLGYSCYIEACGIAPSNIAGALGARAGLFEAGEVRVHPTGTVTVFTGSHSHGQGHETTFAQVVAAKLGIPVENIEIVHGDTGRVPFGMGTYGSRSLSVGGTAIVKAVDKIIAKGKKIAAHLLEAADTDIEFENGEFKVAGTDRKLPFAQVVASKLGIPVENVEIVHGDTGRVPFGMGTYGSRSL
ncbi:MAG: xanthine dehydrogenase family protein molybdopterin-binding subunit, partial [Burkholderiaceae bacterium]